MSVWIDDALRDALVAIDVEVNLRKKANIPYAWWAFSERQGALREFLDRSHDLESDEIVDLKTAMQVGLTRFR